jgi:hypothetical protein
VFAEVDNPPRRRLLGSDAYALVHAALADRLTAFEAQKDVAYSTSIIAATTFARSPGMSPSGVSPRVMPGLFAYASSSGARCTAE